MNIESKILPVSVPAIAYMPWEASTLAVAMGNENIKLFIYNNYIQLGLRWINDYHTGIPIPNLYFLDTPKGITIRSVPYPVYFINCDDFIKNIKSLIDKEYYIYLNIDTYYIKSYSNYHNIFFLHQLLIYGYDCSGFYIADFFSQGKYSFGYCTFEELNNAFNSALKDLSVKSWDDDLILFKVVEENIDLDIYCMINNIRCFLDSRNFSNYTENQLYDFYGIKIFEQIDKYLQLCQNNKDMVDERIFNCLYTHNKLMVERIDYIYQKTNNKHLMQLSQKFKVLQNLCDLNQNLCMKNNCKFKINTFDKIIANFNMVRDSEYNLMLNLRFVLEELL